MPTYPTDQERVEAHEAAAAAREAIGSTEGRNPADLFDALKWLAAELRSFRLEYIAANAIENVEAVAGQMHAGEFVPDPEVLEEVPEGNWAEVGNSLDLAFSAGHTAGFPPDASAIKLTREDGAGEIFVTAEAWRLFREEPKSP